MTTNTLCMLEIPTNLHTFTSQNFRYKILELQMHTPHETYNCQTLSLTRSLLIFIIPHDRLLHLVFNYIKLKDVKHRENNLSFIKLQPSTPSGILPSIATRYYSLFKTLMHTTPTKIKEQQITRNFNFFFRCSKPKRCPPCRITLLHICTAPHPSRIPSTNCSHLY
jgi:hypothetical protein